MEVLRYTQDVFGQKMLVGMNWELLWLPVATAAAAILVHLLSRYLRQPG
jgi:hypothetical protein